MAVPLTPIKRKERGTQGEPRKAVRPAASDALKARSCEDWCTAYAKFLPSIPACADEAFGWKNKPAIPRGRIRLFRKETRRMRCSTSRAAR